MLFILLGFVTTLDFSALGLVETWEMFIKCDDDLGRWEDKNKTFLAVALYAWNFKKMAANYIVYEKCSNLYAYVTS